ncbi:hypothetical protein FGB62_238g09 [Gracilaria domingensis]|nr:hypothetical protein FGB62_238g09 [Gracilaria domingensis]
MFTHTTMHNVLFENCTFESSLDVMFEKFALDSVTFKNYTFNNHMRFSHGDVKRITISHATLGTHSSSGSPNDGGEILMSDMSLSRALVHHTNGSGYIRFQSASVEDFEVQSSRISSVMCHEEVKAGAIPKKKISLQTAMFKNVSFTDGFYCDKTEITGLHLLDVKIRNYIDLSKSDITNLVINNVTSYTENVCSTFSLADAIVDGKTVADINTTEVTMAGAKFLKGIMFINVSISSKDIDLTGTIFSQEVINKECCTLSCLESGCMCDISHESVVCPRGNSTVNVNAKDSCFPALSLVKTVTPLGHARPKPMSELNFGDAVIHGSDSVASDVFFFGHKSESQWALYRRIIAKNYETAQEQTYTLHISESHFLPVAGRGEVPARLVTVGDKLFTDEGGLALVLAIEEHMMKGMYSPITMSGSLSVDGIIVSVYTDIIPKPMAVAMLSPLRALYQHSTFGRFFLGRVHWLHERSAAIIVRQFKEMTTAVPRYLLAVGHIILRSI